MIQKNMEEYITTYKEKELIHYDEIVRLYCKLYIWMGSLIKREDNTNNQEEKKKKMHVGA